MERAGLGQDDRGTAPTLLRKGALLRGVVTTQLPSAAEASWVGIPDSSLTSGRAFAGAKVYADAATQQLCVREHTPSPGNNCETIYSQVRNHKHARDCSGLPRS